MDFKRQIVYLFARHKNQFEKCKVNTMTSHVLLKNHCTKFQSTRWDARGMAAAALTPANTEWSFYFRYIHSLAGYLITNLRQVVLNVCDTIVVRNKKKNKIRKYPKNISCMSMFDSYVCIKCIYFKSCMKYDVTMWSVRCVVRRRMLFMYALQITINIVIILSRETYILCRWRIYDVRWSKFWTKGPTIEYTPSAIIVYSRTNGLPIHTTYAIFFATKTSCSLTWVIQLFEIALWHNK